MYNAAIPMSEADALRATPAAAGNDPVIERLEDQIAWYDRKSAAGQNAYKRIKVIEICAAALIPFVAASDVPHIGWVTGGLGVLITILEGLLNLNQYQQNWAAYRSTAEALKHEKFVFVAQASEYAAAENPRRLLAERIESLVSQEHTKWAVEQQKASATRPAHDGAAPLSAGAGV